MVKDQLTVCMIEGMGDKKLVFQNVDVESGRAMTDVRKAIEQRKML